MKKLPLEKKYEFAAEVVCDQGPIRYPVNATVLSILKNVVQDNEEELDFIAAFAVKPSQTMDDLKKRTAFSEQKIDRLARRLAAKGLVFNQPNSSGAMVYRILPLMAVGLMEYAFMGELKGSKREKALARLFEALLEQVRDIVQQNYDPLIKIFKASPPIDRTIPSGTGINGRRLVNVPVKKRVVSPDEFVLPSQSVKEIIDKFEEIGVGHCFCRQRRKTLGEPCATEAPMRNCFTFGKSARHTISQGFARPVTKQEALKIMQEAEAAGLIHKAFHPGGNEAQPETSICNCCKDCCDTFKLWRDGAMPLINSTNHLAVIDPDTCAGCGTCIERCPTGAVSLNEEGIAVCDETSCIGCGLCAGFCPEQAVSLAQGLRTVFIMPPRLRK